MSKDNDDVVKLDKSVSITEQKTEIEQLKKFGNYAVQRLLGKGAFAKVYLAKDKLNRSVALKILKKQYAFNDSFVRNFRKEAGMVARLNHENIVQIYDQDEIEGQFFIAMEYAPGGSLRDYAKDQEDLSHAELRTFIRQIANALDAAHQDNIVHRDIKPSNILLGYNNRIKLADFGIARAVTSNTERQSDAIQGTAAYMAPEQADPNAHVDSRADIYSFAVVIYEMLSAGLLPFGDGNRADFVNLITQKRKSKPKDIEGVPKPVMRILVTALQAEPNLRPSSAGSFATDLIRSIYTWEQNMETRQDKRDLSGLAISAMEGDEWQAAKDYWERSLKIKETQVAHDNLRTVKRELALQDAWGKVSEGFDKAEWESVLSALDDIRKMDPGNNEAVPRREEASLQLKMQRLYEEGDEAFIGENYSDAVEKFEAIYERVPNYRDVAERLEEFRKNRVKEELNLLREKALLALVEGDLRSARIIAKDISRRAPQGEYGVEPFLERFDELSTTLEKARSGFEKTLISNEHTLEVQAAKITSLAKENEELEVKLSQVQNRVVALQNRIEQKQQMNSNLQKEFKDKLVAYFDHLQGMVQYLDSRNHFLKTSASRGYANQLRTDMREILIRGEQLESNRTEEKVILQGGAE